MLSKFLSILIMNVFLRLGLILLIAGILFLGSIVIVLLALLGVFGFAYYDKSNNTYKITIPFLGDLG